MQFLSRLMPRENRFFELFNQHAKLVVAAGEVLVELLKGFTSEEGKRGDYQLCVLIEKLEEPVFTRHQPGKKLHSCFAL